MTTVLGSIGAAQEPATKASPLDRLDPARIADSLRIDKQPQEVVAIVPAKDGGLLAALGAEGKLLALASPSGAIRVWDLGGTEPKLAFSLQRPKGEMCQIALSPDGKLLASGCLPDKSAPKIDVSQFEVMLWDVTDNGPKLRNNLQGLFTLAIAFSPDSTTLAVYQAGPFLAKLDLWSVARGKPKQPASYEDNGERMGLAFSPDGKTVALAGRSGTAEARLLDLSTGTPKAGAAIKVDGASNVESAAFWPDGKSLAVVSDGNIELWDIGGNQPKKRLVISADKQFCRVSFAPDGKRLVAASQHDKKVVLWSAEGKQLEEWRLSVVAVDVVFAADSRHFVVTTAGGAVLIFRLPSSGG
jgi:WD40 repeat protein